MLADTLLALTQSRLSNHSVTDLRVGLSYTAVLLDNGHLGVAATLNDWPSQHCTVSTRAGRMKIGAWQSAQMLAATNPVDAAVGLATVNAVLNQDVEGDNCDLLERLDIKEDDTVAMVGYFHPFVANLKDRCNLMIFERKPVAPGVLPDWSAERLMPDATVVILSATTFVNKTIDRLLQLARPARSVAIAGPSTPLIPELFEGTNVKLLAGMEFTDPSGALDVISQAGGTRRFSPYARKVTLELK